MIYILIGTVSALIGIIVWSTIVYFVLKDSVDTTEKPQQEIVTDYETGFAILKKDAIEKELHQSIYLVSSGKVMDKENIFRDGFFISKIYFAKSTAPKWDRVKEELVDINTSHFITKYYKDNVEVKGK